MKEGEEGEEGEGEGERDQLKLMNSAFSRLRKAKNHQIKIQKIILLHLGFLEMNIQGYEKESVFFSPSPSSSLHLKNEERVEKHL